MVWYGIWYWVQHGRSLQAVAYCITMYLPKTRKRQVRHFSEDFSEDFTVLCHMSSHQRDCGGGTVPTCSVNRGTTVAWRREVRGVTYSDNGESVRCEGLRWRGVGRYGGSHIQTMVRVYGARETGHAKAGCTVRGRHGRTRIRSAAMRPRGRPSRSQAQAAHAHPVAVNSRE